VSAADLIDTYVAALASDDAGAALATLSADAEFHSPFNAWRSRHVPAVFRARCDAFASLRVNSVVRGHDRAVILWSATANGAYVEAAELVTVSDGAVCRVDVFLRPAHALDAVHQAMAAAWPRLRA
jgi:SnoaL-like protein